MKNLMQKIRVTLEKQQRQIRQQRLTIVSQGEIIRQLNGAIENARKSEIDYRRSIDTLRRRCFDYEKKSTQ